MTVLFQLFTWWHQVRDGTLSRARFQVHIDDLCVRVRFHLCYGQRFADARTAAPCANLLDLGPALWTFAYREGVEPTNNEAERALRHGVLWRHTSFGTHSAGGSRFVERLLTVRDTLRQQQRNVLDYLRMACDAAVSQQPAPSLLPSTHSAIRWYQTILSPTPSCQGTERLRTFFPYRPEKKTPQPVSLSGFR